MPKNPKIPATISRPMSSYKTTLYIVILLSILSIVFIFFHIISKTIKQQI